MINKFIELPTHFIIGGKRYPLDENAEDPKVAEHNRKCWCGELPLLDYILASGKKLRDATGAEVKEEAEVNTVRGMVCHAIAEILLAYEQGDKQGGQERLFELYRRFELWPPLDARRLQ